MRQLLLAAVALSCALAVAFLSLADPAGAPAGSRQTQGVKTSQSRLLEAGSKYLIPHIRKHRRETWKWQTLMRAPRSRSERSAERSLDPAYRRWVLNLWKKRAARARRQASDPPRESAWMCIHRHEGAWNDPNPPYYGGLQMDLQFQRTYGPELLAAKGTADNWTPLEQIWVAERAYRSGRGFNPWPNTARMCGLL